MKRTLGIRFESTLDPAALEQWTEQCRIQGATIHGFTTHADSGRSFAILVVPANFAIQASGAVAPIVSEPPSVALWIVPRMPEAVPLLAEALGGSGRPAGVTLTARTALGIVVEVQDEVTPVLFVVRLVDVELGRFGQPGRSIEIVSPITAASAARIASQGLQEPHLRQDRIIEYHLQDVL